jgi:hypothetical protein
MLKQKKSLSLLSITDCYLSNVYDFLKIQCSTPPLMHTKANTYQFFSQIIWIRRNYTKFDSILSCILSLYTSIFISFVHIYGVRRCIWTAANKGPIVHPPDDTPYEYGSSVEWYWQGKSEELRENSVPVPLYPPQIPNGVIGALVRPLAVIGRQLTAWAMARPILLFGNISNMSWLYKWKAFVRLLNVNTLVCSKISI